MTIGLGIRFKEAVAVSLVALTLVAVTTAVHLAQLTRVEGPAYTAKRMEELAAAGAAAGGSPTSKG